MRARSFVEIACVFSAIACERKDYARVDTLPAAPSAAAGASSIVASSSTVDSLTAALFTSDAGGPTMDTVGVRQFVEEFYDAGNPRDRLSDLLTAGLRADSILRSERPGNSDVLEGNPWLWSQDPCAPYKVTEVHAGAARVFVTVVEACPNSSVNTAPPRPIVQVTQGKNGFEISDVFYVTSAGIHRLSEELCEHARQLPEARRPGACKSSESLDTDDSAL